MKKKILKDYIYTGLGFPVTLHHVELIQINGEWHPKIDIKEIAKIEINHLITQESRLLGNQVKFIRSYFNMSLREFGNAINESHAAVKKWEDYLDKPTKMDANIEVMMRLFIYNRLHKHTKENKIAFYDNYVQIKNALYRHPNQCC